MCISCRTPSGCSHTFGTSAIRSGEGMLVSEPAFYRLILLCAFYKQEGERHRSDDFLGSYLAANDAPYTTGVVSRAPVLLRRTCRVFLLDIRCALLQRPLQGDFFCADTTVFKLSTAISPDWWERLRHSAMWSAMM